MATFAGQAISTRIPLGGGLGGAKLLIGQFTYNTTGTSGELTLEGRQLLHVSFTPLGSAVGDAPPHVVETFSGGICQIPSTGTVTVDRNGTTSGQVYSFEAKVR